MIIFHLKKKYQISICHLGSGSYDLKKKKLLAKLCSQFAEYNKCHIHTRNHEDYPDKKCYREKILIAQINDIQKDSDMMQLPRHGYLNCLTTLMYVQYCAACMHTI